MNQAKLVGTLNASIETHAFSGVVCIHQRGRTLYERAAGYAERSNHIENTLETRFGIASGTKFLTALAIGKLIAANKLSFSTKLKDCLTLSFPRYSPDITIQHLLSHTSGIPDYYDEEKISDFDHFALSVPVYQLRGPRDYLAVFPEERMKFSPGERFSYSNGGYILLGIVIEELSGQKYQRFVEQEIFEAVGMDRSGFFAFDRLPEKTAVGYIKDAEGWRTNIYNLPIVGASDGGAYTTVHDLASLWIAFWGYKILPKELVETYAAPFVKVGESGGTHYGQGLWLAEDANRSWTTYIIGGDAGVSFKSSVKPEGDLQITVISNTSDGAWSVLKDIDMAMEELSEE